MSNTFSLTVTVPAEEWARINMRVRYLEAAVIQAYRNERQIREWFSVSDLLYMELPALPTTRQGLLRKAHAERWLSRTAEGRGGEHFEFHFSSLPRRAFEELITRTVAPRDDSDGEPVARSRARTRSIPANAEPPWLLPLMRLLKGRSELGTDEVCRALKSMLPAGVAAPSLKEVEDAVNRIRQGRR